MATDRLSTRAIATRTSILALLLLTLAVTSALAAGVSGPEPGDPARLERAIDGQAQILPPTDGRSGPAVVTLDEATGPIDLDAPQYSARPAAEFWLGRRVGSTYYVKPSPSGNGSGSDWANASGDLQAMLAVANAGDRIWVAAGIYRPGPSNDRNSSFELKSGVAVYGGFAGNEGPSYDLSLRDFVANETILSGDLLGDDAQQPLETDPATNTNVADNAFSVIDASGVASGTILDGFTVTAGRADVYAPVPADSIRGGGVYMNTGVLTVANCRFVGGRAGIDNAGGQNSSGGAGIYALDAAVVVTNSIFTAGYAFQGPAIFTSNTSLEVTACEFVGNYATRLAGAVATSGTLAVRECSFTDNVGYETAGALFLQGPATLENSTFARNRAMQTSLNNAGAAVYAIVSPVASQVDVVDCTFLDNIAVFGGAIFSEAPLAILRSHFEGNFVKLKGAGIQIQNSTTESVVDSCTFVLNTAGDGIESQGAGGGINVSLARLRVSNSTFDRNNAVCRDEGQQLTWGGGGAISLYTGGQSLVTIENSEFLSNSATFCNGGAILAKGSRPNIVNSRFQGNAATWHGGAIAANADFAGITAFPTITDCRFTANDALFGGGLMSYTSHFAVERTVFDGNTARNAGAGMSVTDDALTTITNALFYGNAVNEPTGGAGGLFVTLGATPLLTNVTMTANVAPLGAAIYQIQANSNATLVNSILYGNPGSGGFPFFNSTDLPGCTGTLSYTLMEEAACPPGANCGAGMIYATDPQFVGPADPRLLAWSPAIDAGTNVGAPTTDLLDVPRALSASDPADLGAFEFLVDCNGNGIADVDELTGNPSLDCNANGFLDACEIDGMDAYGRVALSGNSQGISSDGTYAYVVDESANRVDVLDTSNPLAPTVVGSSFGIFGPGGNPRYPLRVDDTLYIGSGFRGIHIFDVSDPTTPTLLRSIGGGSGPGLGQPIGRFTREGNYLFVPLDPLFSYPPGLTILDITNRGLPSSVAFVPTTEILSDVVASGTTVYASVRSVPGVTPTAGLYVFDIQTPNAAVLVQQIGTPDEARGIALVGTDHLLVAGVTSLEVYDVSVPTAAVRVAGVPLSSPANGLLVDGNVAYVSGQSELAAFDCSDPLSPQPIGAIVSPAPISQTTMVQGRLVASCTSSGVAVFSPVALDGNGDSIPDVCQLATAVPPTASSVLALYPAIPNPFNPRTTIRFDLPRSGFVELSIYDVSGRRVRTLVQETRGAGRHDVVWTGRDDGGRQVASGVYLYRLQVGGHVQAGRMTLLK